MKKNNAVLEYILQADNSTQRELMLSGFINHFQHMVELSWKLCKQLLEYENVTEASTGSPAAIIKYSLRYGYIDEWGPWKNILDDRNELTHIYDPAYVIPMAERIKNVYTNEFQKLADRIEDKIRSLYEMGLLPEKEIDDVIIELISKGNVGHQ